MPISLGPSYLAGGHLPATRFLSRQPGRVRREERGLCFPSLDVREPGKTGEQAGFGFSPLSSFGPFLTETHECLLGRELPQDSSWASCRIAALAAAGRQGRQSSKPTNPGHLARRGRSLGSSSSWAPGPALAPYPWRDSSSSSANVSSLRASILNSLRLMNKHSFFNGEEKAPDFFFLKKSPKPPPTGGTDTPRVGL